MTSTPPAEHSGASRREVLSLLAAALPAGAVAAPPVPPTSSNTSSPTMTESTALSTRQLAIGPIAAHTATGHMPGLAAALNAGLDQGLTVNELKEILVQLYAYAGFPRALNALGECMKVLEARRARGLTDAVGKAPGPAPTGPALLDAGTANQTRLTGAPVKGPMFDFAPAIDQFLKAHLFGDIFARDNLDWTSRELATVAALSAMSGVESQLLSHIRISLNVGLSAAQLKQFGAALGGPQGDPEAARRLQAGLAQQLGQALQP